jgi:tetratricopeptide (TPR) repeat protein
VRAGWTIALSVLSVTALSAQAPAAADVERTIDEAYRSAYNLDLPSATAAMRSVARAAPDQPRAQRVLAAILWLDILFQRGAVTIDHYLSGIGSGRLSLPPPPPALAAEFRQSLSQAIELAEARLSKDPNDVAARDELGKAFALQASYVASIEGSMTSAMRSARRAFDAQETILTRDPRRVDAGVIVGLYRYVVSTMALPSRLVAYVMGLGGGKERGISLLQAAAEPPYGLVEARAALVLIFAREHRHQEGLAVMRQLAAQFPRNRIFLMEEGAAALRAGQSAEADALLTRGLTTFGQDSRPKIPGELSLWLYKRGQARLRLNRPAAAAADFEAALASGPVRWTVGRLQLELGKIDDLARRRADAIAKYRLAKRIADEINDPAGAAEANRLLRAPYTRQP